jgi:thioredoxin reductase
MLDTVIIGAGPYGLSVAAHLKARRVDFRIFGRAMDTWLNHMPEGMKLKSEGLASSLFDPKSELPLSEYCEKNGLPYADYGLPVPLDTFCSYGLEFQRKYVPNLEDKLVTSLRRDQNGFRVRLDSGEEVAARRVVMAIGLGYYKNVPPWLAGLPEELVSHSWKHRNLDSFKGREVAIIGAGASALDLASLLHQAGAAVHVVARKPQVRFLGPPDPGPRPLSERLCYPTTGIGPGWRMVFFTQAPLAFRKLPRWLRLEAVRRTLGPAPCWFSKDEVMGKVSFHLGLNIARVLPQGSRVKLELVDDAGTMQELMTDNVIAATGYKVDLRRIAFLAPELASGLASVDNTPILSSNFESSVPGLYFAGITAANTFGPMLRFAVGAKFAANRLSGHLARTASRGLVQDRVPLVGTATHTGS